MLPDYGVVIGQYVNYTTNQGQWMRNPRMRWQPIRKAWRGAYALRWNRSFPVASLSSASAKSWLS